jgi:hypothetical protein
MPQLADDEHAVVRLKPAWKSFLVYYAAAAFLAAMAVKTAFFPYVGRPFPLSPGVSTGLAAAAVAYVLFKRRGTEFVVTNRRVVRSYALGFERELELTRIDELSVYQTLIQRSLLGTGKVVMADSADISSRMQFFGVEEPRRVKETIARLISESRQ